MKQKIAEKWVKALRSGKYKQTKHSLKDDNGYCCLGVLCEISGMGEFKKREELLKNKFYQYITETETDGVVLPALVMSWSGIQSVDGDFRDENLTAMNDCGFSFKKIADIIEKNYKIL